MTDKTMGRDEAVRVLKRQADEQRKYLGLGYGAVEANVAALDYAIQHLTAQRGEVVGGTMDLSGNGNHRYATPPATQQAEAQAVAWPEGLIDRIKSAEQRIHDNHAPRRIPADPTDVDLVLAEARLFLEGKPAPFWLKPACPPVEKAEAQAVARLVIVGRGGGFKAIRTWDDIGDLPPGEHFLFSAAHPTTPAVGVEDWKARALAAEADIERMTDAFNRENGPTFMGEPAISREAFKVRIGDYLSESELEELGIGADWFLYLSQTIPPALATCITQYNTYKLSDCPCCGGSAEIIGTYPTNEYSVICRDCGLETAHKMLPSDAVRDWNRRHAPDEEGADLTAAQQQEATK